MSRAIVTKKKNLLLFLVPIIPIMKVIHFSTFIGQVCCSSFQYFVLGNHTRVKTVEEFAHLGGYTVTTVVYSILFHEPVYEWMMKQRKEGIIYELRYTKATISEICYKYGFESLPHFSNFCKKNFGALAAYV